MQGPRYLSDSIFRQNDDAAASFAKKINQPAAESVDFGEVMADISFRPDFLEDVVEMGQVDKLESGLEHLFYGHRRLPDPFARPDGRGRPPELKKWELPELPVEFVPQFRRDAVTVRKFSPVGAVNRPRRHGPVNLRNHVIPPERIRAGKGGVAPFCHMPNLLGMHQPV